MPWRLFVLKALHSNGSPIHVQRQLLLCVINGSGGDDGDGDGGSGFDDSADDVEASEEGGVGAARIYFARQKATDTRRVGFHSGTCDCVCVLFCVVCCVLWCVVWFASFTEGM